MGKFRESRTAKNLLISFAAESQAQARYTYFSNKAFEEGYIQIANIFREISEQELEHGLRFFKFFNGGELEFTATFPTGVIESTYDNLISSAELEKTVHTEMYPKFADIAREESFRRAAETWDAISVAERHHEKSFLSLADNIKTGKILKREKDMIWKCRSCGYIHEGKEAPVKCLACVKPAGYFELLAENW